MVVAPAERKSDGRGASGRPLPVGERDGAMGRVVVFTD
jgi:hypothetical protein